MTGDVVTTNIIAKQHKLKVTIENGLDTSACTNNWKTGLEPLEPKFIRAVCLAATTRAYDYDYTLASVLYPAPNRSCAFRKTFGKCLARRTLYVSAPPKLAPVAAIYTTAFARRERKADSAAH